MANTRVLEWQEMARAATTKEEIIPYPEGGSGVEIEDKPRWYGLFSNSITLPERPNSDRSRKFVSLVEAMRRMAELPANHDFYLDPQTAKKSEALVALLNHNFKIGVPKLFPHEGDAVLTWDSEVIKRYLTVEQGEIDLMVLNKQTKVRCSEELSFNTADDLKDWLIKFGGIVTPDSDADSTDAL
ncbi:hypothetical protein NKI20_29420 [Mesorhizobium sp. M0830]|uniref:hypothetical protein n=1 Tax=Mesorhizobium sp. M0830 TaxID=2957008 RepID=UPI00333533D1